MASAALSNQSVAPRWAERDVRVGLLVPTVLLVLNLLDGMFTLGFLQLRLAEEANPLMRIAYQASPLAFIVLKLAVVQVGVGILWAHRESAAARAALQAGMWMYAAIVVYHLSFLASVMVGR